SNPRHPLYHLFGSEATLEQYHAMLASYVLRYFSVFDSLPDEERATCESLFRGLVLATDPKTVFASSNAMEALVNGEEDPSLPDIQEVLLSGVIRMADISNAGRPYHVSRAHSLNVMREFFRTGDLELAYGLEMGAYRDRDQGADGIRECQVSFIDYVVRRYAVSLQAFAAFSETCDEVSPCSTELIPVSSSPTPLATLLSHVVSTIDTNRGMWEAVRP
ncbi:hypothetical protein KIPB_015057, partial [Kipferlia bialata]